MIKWLFKYGAIIFLFNTVLLSIKSTYFIGGQIFLLLMGVFLFLLLINPKQIKKILFHKAFSFLLILNIINIVYFLFFHKISDYDAIKYIMARGVQFSIISISIYYNYEYYKLKFLYHISYFVFGIVAISFVLDPFIFSERYSGIIWNPNEFSSVSVIGFSAVLFNYKKKTNFDFFLLILFLIFSFLSGSRGVLLAVPLAYFLKYGFSKRNIIYMLFFIVICLWIISLQIDTSINRFATQGLFNDRLFQYQYAYETLMQKPFFGYGLDKYSYIDLFVVPKHLKNIIIGAHNGYLSILVQYGFLFGSLVLGIVLRKVFLLTINYYTMKDHESNFYIFILIYTLFASFYESLMTGVNGFHTALFWFALSFLSYSKLRKSDVI